MKHKIIKKYILYVVSSALIAFLISTFIQQKNKIKQQSVTQNVTESSLSDRQVDGELVADFPKELVYPEATIVNSKYTTDKNGTYYEAMLETETSLNEVRLWYTDSLGKVGWQLLTDDSDTHEVDQSLVFAKDTMRLGLAIEGGHSHDTEIFINVTITQ